MTPLWTSAEIAAATGGTASAEFAVGGVTFDSREVAPGDLFVALSGTPSAPIGPSGPSPTPWQSR